MALSSSIAELVLKFTADVADVKRGVEEIKQEVGSLSSEVSSSIDSLAGAFNKISDLPGVAAATADVAALQTAVSDLASEIARTDFAELETSASTAGEAVSKFANVAEQASSVVSDVATAASTASADITSFAETATTALEGVKSAFGTISIGNVGGITEASNEIAGLDAEVTKLSTDASQVDFSTFQASSDKAAEAAGNLADSADKISTAVDQTAASTSSAGADLTQFADESTSAFNEVKDAIDSLPSAGNIPGIADAVSEVSSLEDAASSLSSEINSLDFSNLSTAAETAFGNLADDIGSVDFSGFTADATSAFEDLANQISEVDFADLSAESASAFQDIDADIADADFTGIIDSVETLSSTVKSVDFSSLTSSAASAGEALGNLSSEVGNVDLDSLTASAGSVGDAVERLASEVGSLNLSDLTSEGDSAGAAFGNLAEEAQSAGGTIADASAQAVAAYIDLGQAAEESASSVAASSAAATQAAAQEEQYAAANQALIGALRESSDALAAKAGAIASLSAQERDEIASLQASIAASHAQITAFRDAATAQASAKEQADAFVSALERQVAALGKTRTELLATKAAQLQLTDAQRTSVAGMLTQIEAFQKTTKSANLGGLFQDLAGGITGAVNALKGFAAAAIIYETLKHTVVAAVEAFAETEQAQIRLQAVLDATGNVADSSIGKIKDLGEELSKTTLFSDHEVTQAATNLAKFTEITGETFERTLKDAADLAAVTGQSLPAAAEQLGRALENAFAATRLRRVGLLTDAQVEYLKALHEAGFEQERQNALLEIMEKRSAGAAAAIGSQGLASAFTILKSQLSLISQDTGKYISDLLGLEAVLRKITEDVEEFRAAQAKKAPSQATSPAGQLVTSSFASAAESTERLVGSLAQLFSSLNAPFNELLAATLRLVGQIFDIAAALIEVVNQSKLLQAAFTASALIVSVISDAITFLKVTFLITIGAILDGLRDLLALGARAAALIGQQGLAKSLAEAADSVGLAADKATAKAGDLAAGLQKASATAQTLNAALKDASGGADFSPALTGVALYANGLEIAESATKSLADQMPTVVAAGDEVRQMLDAIAESGKKAADEGLGPMRKALQEAESAEKKFAAQDLETSTKAVKALDEQTKKTGGFVAALKEIKDAAKPGTDAFHKQSEAASKAGIVLDKYQVQLAKALAAPQIAKDFEQQVRLQKEAHEAVIAGIAAEDIARKADFSAQLTELESLHSAKLISEQSFIQQKSALDEAAARSELTKAIRLEQEKARAIEDLKRNVREAPTPDIRKEKQLELNKAQEDYFKLQNDTYAAAVRLGTAQGEFGRLNLAYLIKENEELLKQKHSLDDFVRSISDQIEREQFQTSIINETQEAQARLNAEYDITKRVQGQILQITKQLETAGIDLASLDTNVGPLTAANQELVNTINFLRAMLPEWKANTGAAAEYGVVARKALADQTAAWEDVFREAETVFTGILKGGKDTFKQLTQYLKDTLIKELFKLAATKFVIPLLLEGNIISQGVGDALTKQLGPSVFGNLFGTASGGFGGGGGGLLSSAYNSFATSGVGATLGLSTTTTAGVNAATALDLVAGAGEEAAVSFATEGALTTTALTGFGSALGAAIPYVGLAILAFQLLGGTSLFKGPPAEAKGQFGILPVGTPPSTFEDQASINSKFGKLMIGFLDAGTQQFSGEAAKVFDKVVSDSLDAFATRFSPEQSERFAEILKNTTFAAFSGTFTTEDFLQKYGGQILQQVVSEGFAVLAPQFSILIDNFKGTADQVASFSNSLLAIYDATKNLPEAFQTNLIAAFGDVTTKTGEELTAIGEKIAAFAGIVATFGDGITGLSAKLEALDPSKITDFIDALGGAQAATQAFAYIYANFTTASQKTADATKQLNDAFAKLGITSIPQTHAAFLSLLDSIDLTTEAGQQLYASLIKLAPAFVTVHGTADSATDSVNKLADSFKNIKEVASQLSGQDLADARAAFNKDIRSPQEQAASSYAADLERVSNVSKQFGRQLHQLGYSEIPLTTEGFGRLYDAVVAVYGADSTFAKGLLLLAPTIVDIGNVTTDVATQISDAAHNLSSSDAAGLLQDFYKNFLTPQEQAQQSLVDGYARISAASTAFSSELHDLGFSAIPTTTEGFKSLVLAAIAAYGAESTFVKGLLQVQGTILSINGALATLNTTLKDTGVGLQDITNAAQKFVNKFISQIDAINSQSTGDFGAKTGLKINLINAEIATLRTAADAYLQTTGGIIDATEQQYLDEISIFQGISSSLSRQLAQFTILKAQYGAQIADQLVQLQAWYDAQVQALGRNALPDVLAALQQIFTEKWKEIIAGTSTGVGGTQDALAKIIKAIRDFITSLTISDISPLTPLQKLAVAQAAYNDELAKAQAGDQDALQNITQTAKAYLDQARAVDASSQAYTDIFNSVVGSLNDLADAASAVVAPPTTTTTTTPTTTTPPPVIIGPDLGGSTDTTDTHHRTQAAVDATTASLTVLADSVDTLGTAAQTTADQLSATTDTLLTNYALAVSTPIDVPVVTASVTVPTVDTTAFSTLAASTEQLSAVLETSATTGEQAALSITDAAQAQLDQAEVVSSAALAYSDLSASVAAATTAATATPPPPTTTTAIDATTSSLTTLTGSVDTLGTAALRTADQVTATADTLLSAYAVAASTPISVPIVSPTVTVPTIDATELSDFAASTDQLSATLTTGATDISTTSELQASVLAKVATDASSTFDKVAASIDNTAPASTTLSTQLLALASAIAAAGSTAATSGSKFAAGIVAGLAATIGSSTAVLVSSLLAQLATLDRAAKTTSFGEVVAGSVQGGARGIATAINALVAIIVQAAATVQKGTADLTLTDLASRLAQTVTVVQANVEAAGAANDDFAAKLAEYTILKAQYGKEAADQLLAERNRLATSSTALDGLQTSLQGLETQLGSTTAAGESMAVELGAASQAQIDQAQAATAAASAYSDLSNTLADSLDGAAGSANAVADSFDGVSDNANALVTASTAADEALAAKVAAANNRLPETTTATTATVATATTTNLAPVSPLLAPAAATSLAAALTKLGASLPATGTLFGTQEALLLQGKLDKLAIEINDVRTAIVALNGAAETRTTRHTAAVDKNAQTIVANLTRRHK